MGRPAGDCVPMAVALARCVAWIMPEVALPCAQIIAVDLRRYRLSVCRDAVYLQSALRYRSRNAEKLTLKILTAYPKLKAFISKKAAKK